MLTDVHAHYDDKKFDADRHELITAVKKSGVARVINSGANIKSSRLSAELAGRYDFMYATIGVHPHDAERTPADTLDILAGLLKNKKVVAVGEIGLDFFRNFSNKDAQRLWFRKQMDFAAEMKYPAVIHDRDAHGECLAMAKEYKGRVKGVFHCYSGSAEMARELVGLGYMMSFGGVATFENARVCREVIAALPLEHILLETDCPYLAPHPHRGERNDSRYLPLVAKKIAEIKNVSEQAVIDKTGENAAVCFNIL